MGEETNGNGFTWIKGKAKVKYFQKPLRGSIPKYEGMYIVI
jgi:hypothetical protein